MKDPIQISLFEFQGILFIQAPEVAHLFSHAKLCLILFLMMLFFINEMAGKNAEADTTLPAAALVNKYKTGLNAGKDSLPVKVKLAATQQAGIKNDSSIAQPRENSSDSVINPCDLTTEQLDAFCLAGSSNCNIVPLIKDTAGKASIDTKHVPFLTVHGNILYDVNYHSNIDTPYNEKDVYQHTIQTYLDILVKGQYPFRIYLTNRFSNSSLFKNFSDFNFSYNSNRFTQQIKEQVRQRFLALLPSTKQLDSLKELLNKKLLKLHGLEGWINNPAVLQKQVEARERALFRQRNPAGLPKADSLLQSFAESSPLNFSVESIDSSFDSLYAQKKEQADSLSKEIALLQKQIQILNQRSNTDINKVFADIEKSSSPAKLKEKMQELHISDSTLPKGYQTLMAIRSFGLGRSVVNYSELSVKNISVNGVQVEYNPSAYYAFAAGTVDYRFRDFIVQSPGQGRQYLAVMRYGIGLKDGNNIILTYFTGRRQLYNANSTDSSNTQNPSSALMGITLEGNFRLMDNILLKGELAKSSIPFYNNDSTKGGLASQMIQFGDRTNEAYSLKLNAFFPKTLTRIKGSYKHLGINYQSFSIFTDGSSQTAWSASIDQLFFKRQLEIALSANTNDFSNPLLNQQYKSTTVFKSIQATLRKRYWPIISLGYFPSSQITKLGNGQYMENLFYTLVSNITHSYSFHKILMNSTIVYTQFYNHSTDSGFVYFNTRNLLLSQSIFLNKFTLQCNAAGATNQDYQLYSLEGKLQYALNRYLTLGTGIKYNKQTVYNIQQLGYSGEATLNIPKLGQILFSADKGFIPGMNKQLVPNNTGRLSYFKTF